MVNQKLGFITVAICFGYITTLTGLKVQTRQDERRHQGLDDGVARQWKCASIRPVQKITTTLNHADFRPISITPVLCRTLKRIVVKQFLYIEQSSTHLHLCLLLISMPSDAQGPLPLHSLFCYRQ